MWVAHPLGGGRVDALLGKDLHQVVLRSGTIGQLSSVNTVGIVLDTFTLGDHLKEEHTQFGWESDKVFRHVHQFFTSEFTVKALALLESLDESVVVIDGKLGC